jgi:23S rRNA (adenine2030-N6)-methyltransferase
MNYQHQFHAGNFADIFKHCILILCLEELQKNNNELLVIDLNAGLGKYNIFDNKTLKTQEYQKGLQKILNCSNFYEILPTKFLQILSRINVCEIVDLPSKIKFYSGSPTIIKNFLRSQDLAIFCENQENIFYQLKRNFTGNKKVLCLKQDGFSIFKNLQFSKQSPSLILIDPSFEKNHQKISNDYDLILSTLQDIKKNSPLTTNLMWYPIIKGQEKILENFYQKINRLGFKKIDKIIVDIGKNNLNNHKMTSCGIIAINMPSAVYQKIYFYFPKILAILKNHSSGNFKITKMPE